MATRRFHVSVLAMVSMLIAAWASAQVRTTGQIVGTAKDSTGAVVPNAQMILVDAATGAVHETKSGPDGGFVFPNLQPGTYTLTATHDGFQTATLQALIVQNYRATDIVVQLPVAGLSTTERILVT